MHATGAQLRSAEALAAHAVSAPLRHVLIVGGTAAEWAATDELRWKELVSELARAAHAAGACWLTFRPYGGATADAPTVPREAGGCTVVVDGCADGRDRLISAIERVRTRVGPEGITEEAIGAELVAPADAEPDLALVVGPGDHLPPSLVWELAYSELVFADCAWSDLGEKHLHDAIVEFGRRERRFGGLPS